MSFRFLSLFTGMGLFDLGLEAAGWECVGRCEIIPWRRHWLDAMFSRVPLSEDIRAIGEPWLPASIDWVVGGFPCQDASLAGKGAGLDGEKTGLWWEMHRVIGLVRPGGVLAENVPGLRARGLDRVLGSLEELGYTCRTFNIGAESVGAPHRRRRLFIVGTLADAPNDHGRGRISGAEAGARAGAGRGRGSPGREPELADAGGDRRDQGAEVLCGRQPEPATCGVGALPVHGCPYRDDYGRWLRVLENRPDLAPATPQSALCGVADGLSPRVAGRLRREMLAGLGDAVQAEVAFAVGLGLRRWVEGERIAPGVPELFRDRLAP